jgi:protein-tyrosine-phosphatase
METSEDDKITLEKAVEILKKGGLEVKLEQAKLILEFLYKLADITVIIHSKATSIP